MNENLIHGSSTLRVVPTQDWHRTAMSDSTLKDPLFELVYVAEETFEDGYVSTNVCWRGTDPAYIPKKGVNPTSVSYLTRIVWTVKE